MALPAQPNRSLIDGLQCLYHVLGSGNPIGSRELARSMGEEHTRINRLLKTLCAMEYLQQDEQKRYLPGAAVHLLSALTIQGSGLLTKALPVIETLMQETGCAAALGVLWNQQVCYLFHGTPQSSLNIAIGRHVPFTATNSSIGKILLSQKCADDWKSAAAACGVDPLSLQRDLQNCANEGYAIDDMSRPGSIAVCVGCPIVAGLALMQGVDKPEILVKKFLSPLQDAAVQITEKLQEHDKQTPAVPAKQLNTHQ